MGDVIRLERSGLPLYLDTNNNVMALSGQLKFNGMGHKKVSDMSGLLANDRGVDPTEGCYDTYRRILYLEDQNLYDSHKFSYDITIIMPGTINGEFKKTSGHYHGWNKSHTNTYGEVYEVIYGDAMFVLQKSPDFEENPVGAKIEDVIIVTVHEGQTLIVPPNYGHCSVNIGQGPLVFSNEAYQPCPVIYDSVRAHCGMAYYLFKDTKGKVDVKKNLNYKNEIPEPRFASVHENPSLGIDFSKGAYLNFKNHPERFDYLPHPDPYIDKIMSLWISNKYT